MDSRNQHIGDLFEKYFSGQCSPGEQRQVRAWLTDPAYEQEVEAFMKEKWHQLPGNPINDFPEQTRKRYAAIRKQISTRRVPVAWYYVAASMVALLSFGAAYLYRTELLELVDPVEMISYETGPGQQLSVRLPDGSKAWLNAASTLSFPDKFRGQTRDLQLNGEAFFEVQHDEHKPFFVHTPGFYTRVLGTTFNVKAYPGDERNAICVTVATGKVAVGEEDSLRGRQELARLVPNHRGRYDGLAKAFCRDTIAAGQVTAWREGKLVFRQASLKEMVTTLERWYGISIVVHAQGTAACSFTADYYAGIGLRDILEALRITGKIDYEIGNGKVVIRTRDGCQ